MQSIGDEISSVDFDSPSLVDSIAHADPTELRVFNNHNKGTYIMLLQNMQQPRHASRLAHAQFAAQPAPIRRAVLCASLAVALVHFVLIVSLATLAVAIPAAPFPWDTTQPDGTQIQVL